MESTSLDKAVAKTNCTLATIPKELIDGINAPQDQFLGLANLHKVLSNFKDESESFKSELEINFLNISESGVDNSIKKTISTTQSFVSQNKSTPFSPNPRQKGFGPPRLQPKALNHYSNDGFRDQ